MTMDDVLEPPPGGIQAASLKELKARLSHAGKPEFPTTSINFGDRNEVLRIFRVRRETLTANGVKADHVTVFLSCLYEETSSLIGSFDISASHYRFSVFVTDQQKYVGHLIFKTGELGETKILDI